MADTWFSLQFATPYLPPSPPSLHSVISSCPPANTCGIYTYTANIHIPTSLGQEASAAEIDVRLHRKPRINRSSPVIYWFIQGDLTFRYSGITLYKLLLITHHLHQLTSQKSHTTINKQSDFRLEKVTPLVNEFSHCSNSDRTTSLTLSDRPATLPSSPLATQHLSRENFRLF